MAGKHRLVWQHTVYLGVYRLEAIYEHLHRLFPSDDDAYDERPPGRSACAGFVVGADRRWIPRSQTLSSAAWAVGRTADPGVGDPSWIAGFDDAQDQFRDAFVECVSEAKRLRKLDDDPLVDDALLRQLLQVAHHGAGVEGHSTIGTGDITIASRKVRQDKAADLPGYDFLNSFYLDDLGMVAVSPWGCALTQYLTPVPQIAVGARIDVRADPAVVIAQTSAARIPEGRWPSNPDHPLASSQQFAVNHVLRDLAGASCLFGVNGPPGTGKTTMLRDIFAANVVRRAAALAEYTAPDQAFTDTEYTWKSDSWPRRIRKLHDGVTGYEMVVASTNNTAVANVSDELPLRKEVHHGWHKEADYFSDLATEIAARLTDDDAEPPDAWGLVAARLGNSANRNTFNSAFWHGKGNQQDPHDPTAGVVHGLQQLLKDWESQSRPRPGWLPARQRFITARQRVRDLIDQAQAAETRLHLLPTVHRDIEQASAHQPMLVEHLGVLETHRRTAALAAHEAAQNTVRITAQRERHLQAKPGWWENLFSAGRAGRQWRGTLLDFNGRLGDAEEAQSVRESEADTVHQQVVTLQAELDQQAERLLALRSEHDHLRVATAADKEKYGTTYPDSDWQHDDHARELNAAWQNRDINEARSKLLFAALELHHAFLANATGIRQGLMCSLDVMLGDAPRDLKPEIRQAAWQLLFLAVPLISTTFASVGRMLQGLEREALGWLFIDEAGQAVPEAAVGAIWRTRRVVIIGDPLQLTPVVTIPTRAEYDLAAHFGVSADWVTSKTSAQSLADRVGTYGTTLTSTAEPTWVSAPLRVHRRCDNPMFTISNTLAYDGLMLDGVHRTADDMVKFENTTASQWIDVPGPTPGTHFQAAEIAALRRGITAMISRGHGAEQIIAISPFRAVANELKRLAHDYPGMTAGTIHTAQGREADIVFLVLGGDPTKPGAKRWASKTPNLLNVAASRAKRRLFVIGDKAGWSGFAGFDLTADLLAPPIQAPVDD